MLCSSNRTARLPVGARSVCGSICCRFGRDRLSTNVRFSNRPFGVKRFQTIHRDGVDVAHGLVLLFGIGTRGPSIMGFEDEAEQSLPRPYRDGRVQADMRTHLIHRPARDIIPPLGGARVSFYWIRCCTVFMLLLWPVLGSNGTRCRQPTCGA